jgi:hypothetical protein
VKYIRYLLTGLKVAWVQNPFKHADGEETDRHFLFDYQCSLKGQYLLTGALRTLKITEPRYEVFRLRPCADTDVNL